MSEPREFCIVEHRPDNFSSLDHYRCWLRPKDSHEASSTIIVIEAAPVKARIAELEEALETAKSKQWNKIDETLKESEVYRKLVDAETKIVELEDEIQDLKNELDRAYDNAGE